MSRVTVQISAAKTDRSLVANAPARRSVMPDPQLLFWRRLIDSAVADATRTLAGMPTDSAILSRWWIEEHQPKQSDRNDWERSFECACGWLKLDAETERKRLVLLIDEMLQQSYNEFVRANLYLRRAAVLTCAGVPIAIDKQYQLPLVSTTDYEQVAGIEHGDPPPRVRRVKAVLPAAA